VLQEPEVVWGCGSDKGVAMCVMQRVVYVKMQTCREGTVRIQGQGLNVTINQQMGCMGRCVGG